MRAIPSSLTRERQLVGFSVGDVEYAVPVLSVREVTAPGTVTLLPHTPPAVVGVTNYRGQVVPILDLRVRFGLAPPSRPGRGRWVLVALDQKLAALSVDSVSGVFSMPAEEFGEVPALGGGDKQRGLSAVTSLGGRLIFELDLTSLADLAAGLDASLGVPRLEPRA